MTDYETVDFYTDKSLLEDPHSYFDFLRSKGPVTPLPYRNAVAVTGYEETVQVMLDAEHFSSINAVNGAMVKLPFDPQGDDITAHLEAARSQIEYADMIATQGGQRHTNLRSLVSSLFTPSRLKALEERLHRTSDALIDEFIADGRVNLPRQYGAPYATLVISHLLGIPEDGCNRFRKLIDHSGAAGFDEQQAGRRPNPIAQIGKSVLIYVAQRRLLNAPVIRSVRDVFGSRTAADDILTQLSLAKFPDGTTPTLQDVAGLGAFLFAAGGDTTNLLLANAFRVIATTPDIQTALRNDPKLIPNFIEEMLRFDGSVKCAGRMCQKTTTLAGVEIKAGTPILVSHMAANRDPKRFENPDEVKLDRAKAKEHLAFGRGPHTCIGAPLARRELAISVERLLARMGNIRLSEAHHGPAGKHRFAYAESFTLRVMKGLHLEFDRI